MMLAARPSASCSRAQSGYLLRAQFMFLILIGAVLLFALVYSKVPRKKKPYLHQLPGAIFSAIGWAVF
ncbi:MAG: hypothetical protein IK092_03115, partial [Muribaculaceae bacterium]|nr:hypothetical protein [Muribaculaceae bacterium]